ncbi:MAG: O-antigen ligase family protein, partial [Planctomycetota bacterium]|nr:O-antigen ligase family protein [Planctomycetota bacterium]
DRIGKCLAPVVMAGIVVSTARSALLGCGIGLLLGMALAWLRNRIDRRAMVLSGVATIAVGVLLTLAPGSSMNRGVQEAFQAVNASDGGGVEAYPDQVRPLWWRIGFDAFTAAPVAGQGLGSAKTMIEGDAEVLEITRDGTVNQHAIRDDYHSLFVTVAADGGLVGLLLLAAWIILLGRQLLARGGELDAVLLGAFASFLVFSVLNTTAFSGRLVAFPAILMAFSIRSAPRQAGVREATEGTT